MKMDEPDVWAGVRDRAHAQAEPHANAPPGSQSGASPGRRRAEKAGPRASRPIRRARERAQLATAASSKAASKAHTFPSAPLDRPVGRGTAPACSESVARRASIVSRQCSHTRPATCSPAEGDTGRPAGPGRRRRSRIARRPDIRADQWRRAGRALASAHCNYLLISSIFD